MHTAFTTLPLNDWGNSTEHFKWNALLLVICCVMLLMFKRKSALKSGGSRHKLHHEPSGLHVVAAIRRAHQPEGSVYSKAKHEAEAGFRWRS